MRNIYRSLLYVFIYLILPCSSFRVSRHNIQLPTFKLISTIKSKMGAAISATNFYLYGRKNFTQTGYHKHILKYTQPVQESASIKLNQPGADGIDLTNKVVVITGANSGIGKELATYAAAKGAKLYMFCRSKDRAEKAKEEIVKATSNESVDIVLVDLGEMASVRKAVKNLQDKEKNIDVLVCNGGVLLNDKQTTNEGNEVTFAAHLLGGSYLLSQLLIPQLKASEDPRIIFVSSGGMLTVPFPDWATATSSDKATHKYDGQRAYAYAKRGQVLLAEQYAKLYPNIRTVSAHPGWTLTPAVDMAYGESKKYLEPMRTTWQGAEGIGWLMGTKGCDLDSGEFYLDRSPQQKHSSQVTSYTKNTEKEIEEMIANLKKIANC